MMRTVACGVCAVLVVVGCSRPDLSDPRGRTAVVEDVWRKVDANFYDPQFNGVAWDEVRTRYVAEAEAMPGDDEEAVYKLLDRMLAELRSSHTEFRRPPAFKGEPRGHFVGLGVTTADADGVPVFAVASVDPASAAHAAGVRPGMVIRAVDGASADEHAAMLGARVLTHVGPPTTQALRMFVERLFFTGDVGTEVVVTLADSAAPDAPHQAVRLTRAAAPDSAPAPVEFRELPGGVGYLRFSEWIEPNDRIIEQSVDRMKRCTGLVLDLRGNPGGNDAPTGRIAGLFFKDPVFWGTSADRTGRRKPFYTPRRPVTYDGPLVVLIDAWSASASENFAALVQESGRGKLVGQTTCGCLTSTRWDKVKGGGKVGYPHRITYTSKGVKVEGRGVTPDVVAAPSLADLRAGRDPVLRAAVELLETARRRPDSTQLGSESLHRATFVTGCSSR